MRLMSAFSDATDKVNIFSFKMSRFYHFSFVTAIGVGSFWAGRYFENSQKFNAEHGLKTGVVFAKSLTLQENERRENTLASSEKSLIPNSTENKSVRISQIMKYGFPSLDNIRSLDDFVLSYDQRNRVPNWVIEHLTKDSVKYNENVDRTHCEFYEDPSIHTYFRSQNSDYKGSGFDRGHLAAAGNHKQNLELCQQTFVLSNMAPQVGRGFNRDSWNQLEKYTRKLTKKFPNVYVCTGPLYLPRIESDGLMYVKYRVIGNNSVAVPTHFFKVILMETADRSYEVEAYVMPNQVISEGTPLTSFRVPPESIERAAGLLFFDKVPKSNIKLINGRKS